MNVSSLSSANEAVAVVQRYFILRDLPLGCDLLGRREALQFASSGSNSTLLLPTSLVTLDMLMVNSSKPQSPNPEVEDNATSLENTLEN